VRRSEGKVQEHPHFFPSTLIDRGGTVRKKKDRRVGWQVSFLKRAKHDAFLGKKNTGHPVSGPRARTLVGGEKKMIDSNLAVIGARKRKKNEETARSIADGDYTRKKAKLQKSDVLNGVTKTEPPPQAVAKRNGPAQGANTA